MKKLLTALLLTFCAIAFPATGRAAADPVIFDAGIGVGQRAILQSLAKNYLPQIAGTLGVELSAEPIYLGLTEDPSAPPGVTIGRRITLSAPYLRAAPYDAGMFVHELVHVVQAYPGNVTPWWLLEGIADYVRDYCLLREPARWTAPADANVRGGYTHTAALLDHIIRTRHGGDAAALLHPLNAAFRRGENGEAWLVARYGCSVDDFAREMRARKKE
ncbi:MAG: basic secretory protein-like protein [Candidatus Spyradosoma sp.]